MATPAVIYNRYNNNHNNDNNQYLYRKQGSMNEIVLNASTQNSLFQLRYPTFNPLN